MPYTVPAYKWGEDRFETLRELKGGVFRYISNELDNGPGWVATRGPDAWDIEVAVMLRKKPRARDRAR